MLSNVHTRLQAFAIHLAFSVVLFVILAGLILFHWYPDEHWHLGGLRGVALIAAVDLILGPTLTLIVYNKHKKRLKLDLLCIVALQLSALIYGAWSISQGRPMMQVLTHEGIYIVTKTEVRHFGVDMNEVKQVTTNKPARVYMELPEDAVSLAQTIFLSEYIEDRPIYTRSDLYHAFPPANEEHENMLTRQHPREGNCLRVQIRTHHLETSGCMEIETGKVTIDK